MTASYTGGVSDTSIQAYWSERLAFRLGKQAVKVLDNLYIYGPGTRAELVQRTDLKINVICGRVNELIKAGCVEEFEKTEDPSTHKQVNRLRVKEVL